MRNVCRAFAIAVPRYQIISCCIAGVLNYKIGTGLPAKNSNRLSTVFYRNKTFKAGLWFSGVKKIRLSLIQCCRSVFAFGWTKLQPAYLHGRKLVRTGNLRRAVGMCLRQASFERITFGLDIPYAKYLNNGTKFMPARPFIKDSPLLREKQMAAINKHIKKVFE